MALRRSSSPTCTLSASPLRSASVYACTAPVCGRDDASFGGAAAICGGNTAIYGDDTVVIYGDNAVPFMVKMLP
eukprot:438955-Rhodomonas_salina.2